MAYKNPALSNKFQVCLAGSLTATTSGRSIDTRGAESLCFFYSFGTTTTGTSGTATIKLQDSADNSTFADITGATTSALSCDSGGQDAKKVLIRLTSLKGRARYIRAVLTEANTINTAATGPENAGGVLCLGDLAETNPTTVVDTYVAI